jgi:DnaJ domain
VNPYDVLGLTETSTLTDDDVRAAWRRIASATHPDREDGGDAERFALAAAAYNELRTEYGRNEARAAKAEAEANRSRKGFPRWRRILLRVAVAFAVGCAGVLVAPDVAAGIGLAVGAATWLALTIKSDLSPR